MFGFRVYELGVTRGPRKTTRLDVSDPLGDGETLFERVCYALDDLRRRGLLTAVPHLDRAAEWEPPLAPNRGDPQIRVLHWRVLPEGHILVTLQHGIHGEFPEAVGETDSVDLRRRAPVRDFRALILLPEHGTRGRLVVEAINGRCPVTMLVQWIGWSEYERNNDSWVRLRVKQIADRAKVREMARNAEKITAVLTETRPSMPGGEGSTTRLTQTIQSQIKKESLIEEALNWLDNGSDAEYVLRIEEIAGYDPHALDEAGLHFDGAAIAVTENGQTKTLKPDMVRDKFTYEVSRDLQADDPTWVRRVIDTVRGTLSEGTDIQF